MMASQAAVPASASSGLAGLALLGWMDREQAVDFLTRDCLFLEPLSETAAEEIWASYRDAVATISPQAFTINRLPLSAADMKAAHRFRTRYPGAVGIVDFVRLNPLELVVHQLSISTAIADGYREKVMPDKWLQTALLDPPSNPRLKSRAVGDDITFDLPHAEFFLTVPSQTNEIRVSEGDGFVTVAIHGDRALLLRGYHRTFACAQFIREAPNAPHGVLFAVSNQLEMIGSQAEEVLTTMGGPRPPRLGDFFDDRFSLPVTLRRRRYQMRIHCEVVETEAKQTDETATGQNTLAVTQAFDRAGQPDRGNAKVPANFQTVFDEAMKHQRASRNEQAVALYERALFLKPDSVDAHNNLGVALLELGRLDEAIAHYESALALDPQHAGAHTNLGVALAARGQLDRAAAHHRQALIINPRFALAHLELGNICKYRGQLEDALTEYGRAIAIRPDYVEAHFIRSEVWKFNRGDAEMTALEKMAERADQPPHLAAMIHFALAKALEDCKEYPQAFEHMRRGNEIKRRIIQYNEPQVVQFFERVTAVFDRSLLDRFRDAGDPSTLPIFVVGMPRSGSSLIEQILASHPQIHGAGELSDLDASARIVLNAAGLPAPYPECIPTLGRAGLQRIGETYLSRLPAVAQDKTRIVDKMPGNYQRIGLIRMILPNARIIHTMRNPLDTCISCYSKLFSLGHQFSYDLGELGRYYRLYSEMMNHWRSVVPEGAMLDVVYEDVVDDLEGQARRLIEYCGLPWDDRCLRFQENPSPVRTASAAQVRHPLFRSSVARWRRYEADLNPLLTELGDLAPAEVRA